MRTFVAAAEAGRFQDAADDLALTQQAVSKRIAALERDLGVRLFTRTARGVTLTIDGQAFLPHARELLTAQQRAADSVRPGRRALRVDVIARRSAPAALLRGFHQARPGAALEVIAIDGPAAAATEAIRAGTIDASFRAVAMPGGPLPAGVRAMPAANEPLQLLTGPAHPLAGAAAVTPADLAGHRIWIPGIRPGSEWAAFYGELAAAFGLSIDWDGPNFGTDHLLDVLAGSAGVATLVGDGARLLWPEPYGLRRIPVRDPVPVYPHSLVWLDGNPHPALAALRRHVRAAGDGRRPAGTWVPAWAARPAAPRKRR